MQLVFHIIDIFVSPSFRVNAVFDRRVFCRHTEAVKADRLKHVVSAQPVVSAQRVADAVVSHVPHVDAAAWVGKHRKDIFFRQAIIILRLESPFFIPNFLPFKLNTFTIVRHSALLEFVFSFCRFDRY